jgi:hypothetical protein
LVDTIGELSDLASKLNQQSDRLNSIISTTNAKLDKLKIGVEVWLKANPVVAENYHDEYDDEGRRIDRYRKVTLLGFAKVDDQWQLAVKQATFQTETDASGIEYEETVNPTQPQSLLKAGREIRSESMRLIPKLLDALKSKADRLLKNIEAAEKAAEKL